MSATGALRKKLSEVTNCELSGIKVQVDEQKGNFGDSDTAVRLIITIKTDTTEHANNLKAEGCVCTSVARSSSHAIVVTFTEQERLSDLPISPLHGLERALASYHGARIQTSYS